jgi:hypothetical protein
MFLLNVFVLLLSNYKARGTDDIAARSSVSAVQLWVLRDCGFGER